MTIKELRNITGMTQTQFGQYLNIPMRSIQNWESGARKCPDYVAALIEFRVKAEFPPARPSNGQ